MPEQPAAEKTEQPTQRRLQRAKEKGQVAQSQELPAAVSVIVLTGVLALLCPLLLRWFVIQMKQGTSGDISVFSNAEVFINFVNKKLADSLFTIFPLLAALVAGSIFSCILVSGPNVSAQSLRIKLEAVNPIKGFKRLFNVKSLVKLCISIAKLVFIFALVWFYLDDKLDELAALRWAGSSQILMLIARITGGMLICVCIGLMAIAAIDVLFQKWKHLQDLKMTKQEVKTERKDTEGSPELKSRIRSLQVQMSQKRMLQEVPKAKVVLVNPTHVAVALRYEAKKTAIPVVVAKGGDHLASKIMETARCYGVPVIRRPELARAIFATVELGNPIPEALYVAVAEVLAMLHRLRHSR